MAISTLNLFLADLDERKGRLPRYEEVSLIQSRVRKVIKTILLEVRRENPFFRTTLINSGSFYEGTKVGQPDEFDFFIQLDAFCFPDDVTFDELPCSTVLVLPSDSAYKNLIHSFAGPGIDLRNQFCNFSWKRAIKTPFFKLFNSKAKDFERYGMKVFQPNDYDDVISRHGPAYTLHLEWIGGELYNGLRISVDLALAFKINSKPSKLNLDFECPSGRVLKPLFDSLPYFFAVSSYRDVLNEVQPNFFTEAHTKKTAGLSPSNFCLRCSQSSVEQVLFLQEFGPDSGQSKCLRLLKVLRDILFPNKIAEMCNIENEDWRLAWNVFLADAQAAAALKNTGKLVSSYVLKTLVLFEWKQYPEDEMWNGSNLSQRLLSILRRLVDCLRERNLRSFFYTDYNLLHTTNGIRDEHFEIATSIITILVNSLMSIDSVKEYNFGDCLKKLINVSEVLYQEQRFTFFLKEN